MKGLSRGNLYPFRDHRSLSIPEFGDDNLTSRTGPARAAEAVLRDLSEWIVHFSFPSNHKGENCQ